MIIKMKLRDVIHSDTLIEQLGLNPYCCSEGADPDEYITVEVRDVITYTDEELAEKQRRREESIWI